MSDADEQEFDLSEEAFEAWLLKRKGQKKGPAARDAARGFAARNGIIKRNCICGNPKVHMHHPDYDEPLVVAFLCARCHKHEHMGKLNKHFEVHDLEELLAEQEALLDE